MRVVGAFDEAALNVVHLPVPLYMTAKAIATPPTNVQRKFDIPTLSTAQPKRKTFRPAVGRHANIMYPDSACRAL